jgi:hypothetical protein
MTNPPTRARPYPNQYRRGKLPAGGNVYRNAIGETSGGVRDMGADQLLSINSLSVAARTKLVPPGQAKEMQNDAARYIFFHSSNQCICVFPFAGVWLVSSCRQLRPRQEARGCLEMNDLGRDDSNQGSPSIHQSIRAVHQSISLRHRLALLLTRLH